MTLSADEQIKAIQDIQAIIGKEPQLHPAPDWPEQAAWPLLRLMAYEEKRPKYVLDETGSHVIALNLAKLDIDDDKWDQVLEVIDPAQLRALNLSDNKLTRFTTEGLPRLETLNLNGNGALTAFSFPVGGLKSLVRAELNECAFAELVVPAGMSALQALNVRFGKLARLVFEGDCPVLEVLDVRDNQLAELSLPAGFGRLGYLNVDRNGLESIRFGGKMAALHSLWLKENKLTALPEGLLDMEALEALYVYGNAFEGIPPEVISGEKGGNSFSTVISYLERAAVSEMLPLHQAKMILVGNGMVGKSSIRIKLLDPKAPLPKPEERTFGLEIIPFPLMDLPPALTKLDKSINFLLNIWDFGGQGKFRELQQLFCSRKSLYLYVTSHDDLPEKDDYMGLEYWLSMVNAYSFDEDRHSPVIHVVNKIDEKTSLVDQRQIKETFGNIDSFEKISCEELTNFEDLIKAIRNALPKVSKDVFTSRYPKEWLEVKRQLENRQKDNHISYENYWEDICRPNKLKEQEARDWLRILDRIGTVIYFGDNQDLKNWIILNPSWVKDAIYRVVEDVDAIEHEGVLSRRKLDRIWQEDKEKKMPGLTEQERDKMIQLMLAYKLCYDQQNSRGETEYVVPALFSNKKRLIPAHLKQPNLEVKFHYKPFIPAGTVNKLIVTVQSGRWASFAAEIPSEVDVKRWGGHGNVRVYEDLIWRNNVVLHDPGHNAYAWVTEDWEDQAVYLNLFGKDTEALFGAVAQQLESIKAELVATKYIAHLEIDAQGWLEDEWVPLKTLVKLKRDFFAQTSSTTTSMHSVKQLIAQARLREALTQLHDNAPDIYKGQIIQLQGRLNTLLGKERSGTIGNTSANIERNGIMKDALDLLNEMEENVATPPMHVPPVGSSGAVQPPSDKSEKAIYFSYAWGDDTESGESRELIVDELYNSLKSEEFNVIRDKMDSQYGGLISDFMKSIGKGQLIAVFMSDEYLRSTYCMWELYEIFRNSKMEKQNFVERILPVRVENLSLMDPKTLMKYFNYWNEKFTEYSNLITNSLQQVGKAQQEEFYKIRTIKDSIGDLVGYFQDMNAKTNNLLKDNDFEMVKDAIKKRLG